MRNISLEAKLRELRAYPEHCFSEHPSERWLNLCSSLGTYQARSTSFSIERSRKFELVSALQKTIRRADKTTTLKLISGIANMPEEYSYFWRRMCVIACEDIGPADDSLVRFVIACSILFSSHDLALENLHVLFFLAEQMCELPVRSRIYCNCETVSQAIKNRSLPSLSDDHERIVDAISQRQETVRAAKDGMASWQLKNNWRAAGLLKFVGFSLPQETQVNNEALPWHRIIFELPSYCYDQYTRIGLAVLRRLVVGVPGAEALRDFFCINRVKEAHKVLGEALFTVEGGREKSELFHPALRSLEHRIYAHRFGVPFNDWLRLCDLTRKALEDGIIDRLREEVLSRQYGQEKLGLVCQ